jgi:hypothetical protein
MGEPCFPHQTIGNNSARDAHFFPLGLQFGRWRVGKGSHQVRWAVCPSKFPWIRFVTECLDLLQFLGALFKLVTWLELQDFVRPFIFSAKGV